MNELETQIVGSGLTPPSSSGGKLGLIIKIIIGVVIVVVIGGGICLATRIWDPLWNPFRPDPEDVLKEMFTNMDNLKTVHSELKMEINVIDNSTNYTTKIDFDFSGDSDITDPENPKSSGDFNVSVEGGTEGNFSLVGQNRTIGEDSYLKLTSFDIPSDIGVFLMIFGIDINALRGQWIKMDSTTLEGFGVGIPQQSTEEQEELVKKFQDIFKESKIYYIKEELPDEKINGKKAYHYLLGLDNEEVVDLFMKLFEASIEEQQKAAQSQEGFGTGMATMFSLGALKGTLTEFFNRVGEITVEFWIGKKDKLLYKVKLEKVIDSKDLGCNGKKCTGPDRTNIRLEMNYSNFNKPVNIEPPANFKNLKEILQPLQGLLFPPGTISPQTVP